MKVLFYQWWWYNRISHVNYIIKKHCERLRFIVCCRLVSSYLFFFGVLIKFFRFEKYKADHIIIPIIFFLAITKKTDFDQNPLKFLSRSTYYAVSDILNRFHCNIIFVWFFFLKENYSQVEFNLVQEKISILLL